MKKIVFVLLSLLMLFGCSLSETPTSVVESYLNKYNNLDDDILTDMDTTVMGEDLSEENTSLYKDVLIRQYRDLKYEILDESIDKDNATVKVRITVYDLFKTNLNTESYMADHLDEFSDVNNLFDNESFTNYKINEMLKTNSTIDLDVTFELNKRDGNWYLKDPSRTTLEKIHGLYDYTND